MLTKLNREDSLKKSLLIDHGTEALLPLGLIYEEMRKMKAISALVNVLLLL